MNPLIRLVTLKGFDWSRVGEANVVGFQVPNKYVYWAELLLIQVMVPNASFAGHLRCVMMIRSVRFVVDCVVMMRGS